MSEIHDVPARREAAAPDDVSARIQAVLDDRRRSVPQVRAEIEWWLRVDHQLAELAAAVRELGDHPSTPAELRDALAGFRVEEAREGVADAVRLLRVLESRFSRATINIGVSGQARVGKSTLLQSISGLDDGQIPTGKGLPVTAVRSRIFHSPQHQRATLRLHTFDTFVADVLAPHHAQLGLPGLPTSAKEFATWEYPPPGAPASGSEKPSYATLLKRLRDMQAALPSYQAGPGRRRARDLPRRAAPLRRLPDQRRTRRPRPGVAPLPGRARPAHRVHVPARQGRAAGRGRPARPGRGRGRRRGAPHRRPAERGRRGAAGQAGDGRRGVLGRGRRAHPGPAGHRARLRGQARLRVPAAQPGRHRPGPGAHAARRRQPRDQHGRAGPVLPGPGDRRRRRARRVRPGARSGAAPPHRADAGDGRRGAGRHPRRDPRGGGPDRAADRRPRADPRHREGQHRQRRRGPAAAGQAAAPGPGRRAAGARLPAARAGPRGQRGPGVRGGRRTGLRRQPGVDHRRAGRRRAELAGGGPAPDARRRVQRRLHR